MAKMKDRIEIIVTLQKKETRSCMYDSRYKIGGNSLDDFCSWGAWTKRKEPKP